ncbi:MAG: hypothetical protein ACFFBC_00070 [Promethearchaeota archaeon]
MNKITKVGLFIIFVALISPIITFMLNPSSSYVWIILFPIELVIGVIVLIVGLIIGASGKPEKL